MNSTSNAKSKNFKATYLRLLSGTPPTPQDYWAVPELIDAGLASGHYQRDTTTIGRPVHTVINLAPTMQGRLMADELAEQARRQTMGHRIKQVIFGALMWTLGILTPALQELVKEAIKAFLGT